MDGMGGQSTAGLVEAASKLPPEILSKISPLKPPPGVESNFTDPYDKGGAFAGVATALLVLTLIFYGARTYSKLFVIRKITPDDYTLAIGFLTTITIYVGFMIGTSQGPVGVHLWDVSVNELLQKSFTIPAFLLVSFPTLALGFIKLTIFIFYMHLFSSLHWMRWGVLFGGFVSTGFYIAITIYQFWVGVPQPGENWATHSAQPRMLNDVHDVGVPMSTIGLLIDLYLLFLPVPAVLQLDMAKKRKAGVLAIFSFGGFGCLMSALSIHFRLLQISSHDYTWIMADVFLLALGECFVGVMIASMPATSRALKYHLPPSSVIYSRMETFFNSVRTSFSQIKIAGYPSGVGQRSDDSFYGFRQIHEMEKMPSTPAPSYMRNSKNVSSTDSQASAPPKGRTFLLTASNVSTTTRSDDMV